MGRGDAYTQQDYRSGMLNIDANICRLRAVEPTDVEVMYLWENDVEVWRVSGTTAPLSREQLLNFIEQQRYDIYATRQMRLIIEVEGIAVGALDLFDFDPQHARVGIGILIYAQEQRRKGYARAAIEAVKSYGRTTLCLHQLWATVAEDNLPSIALFEGCGFKCCGTRREWLRQPNGEFLDERFYQLIL